jgi:hypothetical protein
MLLFAFTFVNTQQYKKRLFFLLYSFFWLNTHQLSTFSNNNFQITNCVIDVFFEILKRTDLAHINNEILNKWKNRLNKYINEININIFKNVETFNDFNNASNFAIFVFVLILSSSTFQKKAFFASFSNVNAEIVLIYITRHIFLNRKQYMICMKIISHILHSSSSQMLFYVEEKEKVNKNQIIK